MFNGKINVLNDLGRENEPEPGMIEQIALGLLSLKFSRGAETEADKHSVCYLCPTDYRADGAAGFFLKMQDQRAPPEFLSTHPNPNNRVRKIRRKAGELACGGQADNRSAYSRLKQLL